MAAPERDLFPPQKICMAWQQTGGVGGGLYNRGNTCFLNSVLQCLTYTPPLANYLLSRQHSQSCADQGFCMMCTMEVHVEKVLSCSGSAIEPTPVLKELPRIGAHFQLGIQEDAHEFFCYAMDAMQRACLSRSSDWDASSQAGTLIHQVFGGLLRSRVTCLSCKAVSDTYDAFRDIPLDITAASSVAGALADFVKPEHLEGENGYRCSKRPQSSEQRLRCCLSEQCHAQFLDCKDCRLLPSKLVQYPEYLDLGAYMAQAEGEPLLYSLYAILVHEGSSCWSGHYYCFVKASDGCWYKMDDDSVVLCDIETVLCQCAYLLFYARHQDSTPGAGAECRHTKSSGVAKVTQPTAQLKCLYTNARNMGNRQEELEATVPLESYDFWKSAVMYSAASTELLSASRVLEDFRPIESDAWRTDGHFRCPGGLAAHRDQHPED
ncbi:ubiquitin carboxyl-terminal hydrolase 42-like [Cariama cristata]